MTLCLRFITYSSKSGISCVDRAIMRIRRYVMWISGSDVINHAMRSNIECFTDIDVRIQVISHRQLKHKFKYNL